MFDLAERDNGLYLSNSLIKQLQCNITAQSDLF